jgi:hypothetical protein
MSKPLFVCTVCAEDFTRKSSAHRHKDHVHNGQCRIVRFLDYLAGRVSGIYPIPIMPPRLLRRNKVSKRYFPNHIHNQQAKRCPDGNIKEVIYSQDMDRNDRPDPIDSMLTTVRKIVEFKEMFQQLFSPQSIPYAKITNQTYLDTRGEYNHNSELPKIGNQDEDMIDNSIRFGKKLLEFKNNVHLLQSTSQLQSNNLTMATNLNFIKQKQASEVDYHEYRDRHKARKIFGLRICICNSCQDCIPVPVFYPAKYDEATTDNQFFHQCGPNDQLVRLTILDKSNLPRFIRSKIPELLKQVLIGSAQNSWKYLIAIPLSNPPEKEIV